MGMQNPPQTDLHMEDIQNSMLQQAQAAASAQADATRLRRRLAPLEHAALIPSDLDEDERPPPVYGDIYGEISNDQDGLNTRARVGDDGRVNIRINQLDRRLSQVFTPTLRQHIQSALEKEAPPPASDAPPRLNIVLQVVGSRGDVQPFVALGKVLKDTYGHRVRLATHPTFRSFVQENGLEFFNIGGDPSRLMAYMVKNPGLMPSFRSLASGDVRMRKQDVGEYIQGCWRSCHQADDGTDLKPSARPFVADCIIANPPSFAHIHCAEKLGIPLHIMFTMPYSPTQAFPHPLANIQSSEADPLLTNYLSYTMIEMLSWQGLGTIINRFRVKCLGLDPIGLIWAPGMVQRLKIPHTYCWSPALIPKPKDWGQNISISGFYMLKSPDYTPNPDLQAFLDEGPAPIYIGFGSIVLDDPNAMTELIFTVARMTDQRVLLSKGWGGMGADELIHRKPDNVFMLGNVPHDWLFQHVSCVVHHGGAGTTAAGIAAGRPTVTVPFFGDQPFWGAMVAQAGAGPDPIPYKQLTAEKLFHAISFCLKPESLRRARDMASKVAAERGCETGAQSFHQWLDVDRLRCILSPSRSAAWRIKHTQTRLSPFAACTLANANLLDFHDLKLYRPQEYETDPGPTDPVFGGFVTACAAFSDIGRGLAEVPTETVKAFQLPFKSKQRKHQASTSVQASMRPDDAPSGSSSVAMAGESLNYGQIPDPLTSREQSRTSLEMRRPSGSLPASSSASISGTLKDAWQGQSLVQHDSSSTQHTNRDASRTDKDMLRYSGAHGSKGMGRMVTAVSLSPMEFALSFSKGLRNLPKMWGDDTVRAQPRVRDFSSGGRTAVKEFGLGWYDGVTGIATQPWKGAQKEGAAGFFKGMGKGFGGFVAKPGAGTFGLLAYTLKGTQKEVQKLFSGNVQNYIIASRTAQGYEEWLQSSDAEKEDVIARWKSIQKYAKKRGRRAQETVRAVLETQPQIRMNGEDIAQSSHAGTSSLQYGGNAVGGSSVRSAEGSLRRTESDENVAFPVREPYPPNEPRLRDEKRRLDEDESLYTRSREDVAIRPANDQRMRVATIARRPVPRQNGGQQHAAGTLEREQGPTSSSTRQSDSDWELESDMGLDDDEDEQFEQARKHAGTSKESMTAVAGKSTSAQQPPSYDQNHLAGTTRSEFETQRQRQPEKTAQERTEEEIVLEHVKKQSLLEASHSRRHGNNRAPSRVVDGDEEDEELQRASRLSVHD